MGVGRHFDVVVIGAGPAGMFASNQLASNKSVLLLDAGVDLPDKKCRVEDIGKCQYCKPTCHIIGGFGGAQFFEGTKLSIYPAGSSLVNFLSEGTTIEEVYNTVDNILDKHGKSVRATVNEDDINSLKDAFAEQGVEMKYYNAQKVAKHTMNKIAMSIKDELIDKGVEIRLQEQVINISKTETGFTITTINDEYTTDTIIFAVGRLGSRQLTKFADNLGIKYIDEEQEMEIGIRIEMPYSVFDKVNNIHNDLKLKMKLPNDGGELRTFCQDYKGFITKCVYNMNGDDLVTSLDGHIIGTDEEGGPLSNVVNIAVHHRFKVPFSIEKIYDIIDKMSIKKRPIVQSMKNFMENKDCENSFKNKFSMPDVVEANINEYMPEETLKVLKDFINRINNVLPGFSDDTNTVYAPSFEMGWKKFIIDKDFQTTVDGIYIVGDATGHFRGAMQAMTSGLLCAKSILNKAE